MIEEIYVKRDRPGTIFDLVILSDFIETSKVSRPQTKTVYPFDLCSVLYTTSLLIPPTELPNNGFFN